MERLTDRKLMEGGAVGCINQNKHKCNDNCIYGLCKWIKECLLKLKSYEDLEEKGLLVKLPCKVGDTIWWLNGKFIMESEVASFTVDEDGVYFMYVEHHDKKTDKVYSYSLEVGNIGKSVFLIKEEAEAAKERLDEINNS